MTPNIVAYIIYLAITSFVTIFVGWLFFKNGRLYIYGIFLEDIITDYLNKMLLIGYYLINLGLVLFKISTWDYCTTSIMVIENILQNTGDVILILTVLHYINIISLTLFQNKLKELFNNN